ncbi:MAG: histidine kinase [Acidobacteria bacterium]|nr:MAG: histidine kinase [Acidobacteriota bacterium]
MATATATIEHVDAKQLLQVLTRYKRGDFTARVPVDRTGVAGKIYDTVNDIIEQNQKLAGELQRISNIVGKAGHMQQRASLAGASGGWAQSIDALNTLVNDMAQPTTEVARVIGAVAKGDLSQTMALEIEGRPLTGEFLRMANVVNTMVAQLGTFASEVTRVAREVGTDGKLGGQAVVKGVAGTWKDLTDNVNFMAAHLTSQVRNIAEVTTAVARGDLSRKITVDVKGEILELKNTINTMVDQLSSFASEVTRVAREVGTDGKLGGQATVRGVGGVWKDLTDNVNTLAGNLTVQLRDVSKVATAIARGDLTQKITVDVRGELLQTKNVVNTMLDQINAFASEVTRVAREVGTEGKLGGQAVVKGAAGTWKDLTDNVNFMANNLTNQVRGIARVVTDVANGNLRRKLVLEAKGEIEQLAGTINGMIDTLATFADQVTTVAREVGVEGRLGGQASVPGAAGTWRDLVDNVNRLAANLTIQVRAIADVATAVTKGNLSQSIDVDALGEVAALKDNINAMIRNLRETTEENKAQDWLKTNLAKFTWLLQGQRDLATVSRVILSELAPVVQAQHGVFYVNEGDGAPDLKLVASYAYIQRKHIANRFKAGEGLVGQCALERSPILVTDVPDDYVQISSGLGEAKPLNIVVLPVLFENDVKAVIELASFHCFSEIQLSFLNQLTESIGIVLNTIAAMTRTEELLKQSQSLTNELTTRQRELSETNVRLEEQARSLQASEERLRQQQDELQQTNEELEQQQQELQQTNEELEEKAELLAKQNREVENKNREIELARAAIEEKAEQLALTSKYKSEFLANMSHELRTPLNSLLILSKMLAENPDGNLSSKQLEFATAINSSGAELLGLIDEILDLAKIESGTMHPTIQPLLTADLCDQIERMFRQLATAKGLHFGITVASDVPPTIDTDAQWLQRILKNLLSNAFKFTESGGVRLEISVAREWTPSDALVELAPAAVAFSVIDTGIGIPPEKHKIVFEAFQQADGTTGRKYGGTGLGLSISQELARLLGGEIRLRSAAGQGSTFTLHLPQIREALAGLRLEDGLSTPTEVYGGVRHMQQSAALSAVLEQELMPDFADDRGVIAAGDKVVLIVEDDHALAPTLLEVARQMGFRGIVTSRGDAALALAHRHRPDAITLDIQLAATDGWRVLDRLKHDPATRHIPVHIISIADERQRALKQGAFAHLTKPVTRDALERTFTSIRAFIERRVKNLLVVEDDDVERSSIVELIGNDDVHVTAVATGEEALDAIEQKPYDCMVLDLGLSDMSGFELLEELRKRERLGQLPVIVYTGKALSKREETKLRRVAETIIVKDVKSPDRLLDETTLFLHRVQENLPEEKRRMLDQIRHADPTLAGRTVLIVDDDLRNTFALASALEQYQMQVVPAENGRDAIEILKSRPAIDVVLMDVMMPEMDGYEATRAIRALPQFHRLPVIALTAKAMPGDRDLCIDAGASDYITKPVDTDQLISLLRVWLYR